MKRVLLIFYSQSGEAERIAATFASEMAGCGHSVTTCRLRPKVEYPYPWRSVAAFFGTLPEVRLGSPPPLSRPHFDPNSPWDLVILVSPVWFLAPALPVRAFFATPEAAVLKGRPVLTVMVSRAMWQRGSEGLKKLLAGTGARHIDNVAVTHAGSPVATLVSTPRALLSGRSGRFLGIFPAPGVTAEDQERVQDLARTAAKRLALGPVSGSLLAGEPAVTVRRWLILPELAGAQVFQVWAKAMRAMGVPGSRGRAIGAWAFALFLPLMILVCLPLALVAAPLLRLLAPRWLARTAARLAAPTGEMAKKRA